jgi:hypothetical protein
MIIYTLSVNHMQKQMLVSFFSFQIHNTNNRCTDHKIQDMLKLRTMGQAMQLQSYNEIVDV